MNIERLKELRETIQRAYYGDWSDRPHTLQEVLDYADTMTLISSEEALLAAEESRLAAPELTAGYAQTLAANLLSRAEKAEAERDTLVRLYGDIPTPPTRREVGDVTPSDEHAYEDLCVRYCKKLRAALAPDPAKDDKEGKGKI